MEVLFRYLGHFGRYQAFLFALNILPQFMGGGENLMFSWAGFAPDARCRIPALDGNNSNYALPFKLNQTNNWYAEPKEPGQYCDYCSGNKTHCTDTNSRTCDHGHIFDPETALVTNSLTIKYFRFQFDAACEDVWKRELIYSLNTVGIMIGAAVFSPISDKYGRRPVALFCAFCATISGFCSAIAANYYLYAILQVCIGAFLYGVTLTVYILLMEMVDGLPRTLMGIWIQGLFTLGMLYLCLLAYVTKDWRMIEIFVAVPSVIFISYYWLLPESARWLLLNGRRDEAEKNILRAAKMNNVYIPKKVIRIELSKLGQNMGSSDSVASATVLDLFKHWTLAKTTLIVFYIWFAVSMAYYGLAQNTSDLPGSPYVTFVLSAVSELPGFALCVPMMQVWGRKPTLVVFLFFGGLACILSGLLSNPTIVIVLALIGKMGMAAAFAGVYNYSAEVFPTVVRQSGAGYSSICARIGSVLAPQIRLLGDYVDDWLPIVIYGCVAVVAGILGLWLPETKGKELPESIQDGIHFSDKKHQAEKASKSQTRIWTSESLPSGDSYSSEESENSHTYIVN